MPDTLPPWEPPFAGTEAEPWAAVTADGRFDRPFTSAADDDPADLYAGWDDAVARSRARIAEALTDGGLDRPVHVTAPDGRRASLRRLLCDLLEEYGRHTGHADLLRGGRRSGRRGPARGLAPGRLTGRPIRQGVAASCIWRSPVTR